MLRAFCKGGVLLLATASQNNDVMETFSQSRSESQAKSLGQSTKLMVAGGGVIINIMTLFCPKASRFGQAGRRLVFLVLSAGRKLQIPAEMTSPCSFQNGLAPHPLAPFSGLVTHKMK